MNLLLIRHGQPDYSLVKQRKLKYIETNFCPLDASCLQEISQIAFDPRLQSARLILSSPYTRALQTAEIINRKLQLPVRVEFDLHEWKLSLHNEFITENDVIARYAEFKTGKGIPQDKSNPVWEPGQNVRKRVLHAIKKYRDYSRVIVVCHGVVIQCITGQFTDFNMGEIVPFQFDVSPGGI